VEEEGEEGVELVLLGEVLEGAGVVGVSGLPGEQALEARPQPAHCDPQPLFAELALVAARTKGEGGVEDTLERTGDAGGPPLGRLEARLVALGDVGEAGLMPGARGGAVGGPAVTDEDARVVLAEDERGLLKPAPGLNGVHRERAADEDPQPLEVSCHLPAGLIGADEGLGAQPLHHCLVGRLGGPPHAGDGLAKPARGERDAKALGVEPGALRHRYPERFVQVGAKRERARGPSWLAAAPSASERWRG